MSGQRILSTRAPDGQLPDVPGSIRRPCMKGGHSVWVSPASQHLLGLAEVICMECMTADLDDGEANSQ